VTDNTETVPQRWHHQENRPRTAFIGIPARIVPAMEAMCGSVRRFGTLEEWRQSMSPNETDLIVSAVPLAGVPAPIHVFLWCDAPRDIGWYNQHTQGDLFSVRVNTAVEIKSNPQAGLFDSAVEQLVSSIRSSGEAPPGAYVVNMVLALVETTDAPVSVIYRRHTDDEAGYGLWAPSLADPALWLRAYLHLLNRADAKAVPSKPPMLSDPTDWYTPEEAELGCRIDALEDEILVLAAAQDELRGQLELSLRTVDTLPKPLLWADGDALVEAVAWTFADIGFDVADIDDGVSEGDPKREDLHVTTSEGAGWIALAEVKGYSKGAKTNDLRQINQHVKAFVEREGRSPDSVWWIINDFRHEDPSVRKPTLNGNGDEPRLVDVVAIPTTAVFRLWRAVRTGDITEQDAIESLKGAQPGVWRFDHE